MVKDIILSSLPADDGSRPKLIYLVTEDWYFWSHRLPMAEAARDAGFDVAVACRVRAHREQIEAKGFAVHPLGWRRDHSTIRSVTRDIWEIARLYRRERPDIVHHVALRAVTLGSIAALAAGKRTIVVNALTGLGHLFTADDRKVRALRGPIVWMLRWLLKRKHSHVLVQNEDDRAYLQKLNIIDPRRTVTIRGSGVDTDHFAPLPEPASSLITAAYVGRMIEDKGVRCLIAAIRRLSETATPIRLLLAGLPDLENPATIPEAELRRWADDPMIEWVGHVDDIRKIWARSHIAVLASRREGLPKTLLEAAACGRPLVATDVPGCREIARGGENAILVPPDDPAAMADALSTLAYDADLRQRFGAASRRIVVSDMSVEEVGTTTIVLYREILEHFEVVRNR